jgi:hypothetical protein
MFLDLRTFRGVKFEGRPVCEILDQAVGHTYNLRRLFVFITSTNCHVLALPLELATLQPDFYNFRSTSMYMSKLLSDHLKLA